MKSVVIRPLQPGDVDWVDAGFMEMGWSKPAGYFQALVEDHTRGLVSAWVATVDAEYAGHVKIVWPVDPGAMGSHDSSPEIQDLAVIPRRRRHGVATLLLDAAESAGFERFPLVRIGVGLHPGYRAAQRLYILRGYVPDGRGVTHHGRVVAEGESVPFDDELVLHLEKHREK